MTRQARLDAAARRAVAVAGTVLVVLGLGGLVLLGAEALLHQAHETPRSSTERTRTIRTSPTWAAGPAVGATAAASMPTPPLMPAARPEADPRAGPIRASGVGPDDLNAHELVAPITRVRVLRLNLDAEVVTAELVDGAEGTTWLVPPFKAGHAEGTPGAGQPGNAVLFGHVTSRQSGNVFQTLDQARVGDVVDLFSGPEHFEYRVVDVRSVPRTDVSGLDATDEPTISLITCTGAWNPFLWDYSERLIVRGRLVTAD
jgi:LPXTG-site transpeptidase (sortase) family protein